MGLESASPAFIKDLNTSWPLGGDERSTSDDHHRLIKSALTNTFPEMSSTVSANPSELNYLSGATAGVVVASKAVIVDSNKDVGGFRNISASAFYANSQLLTPLISETAQASTSGATVSFTGIPSWVTKITASLDAVSPSVSAGIVAQIGDPTLETTGYVSVLSIVRTANNNTCSSSTSAFQLGTGIAAGEAISGVAIFTLLDSATNTWSYTSNMSDASVPEGHYGCGSKSLSGALSVLTFGVTTGAFDAGKINIMYE